MVQEEVVRYCCIQLNLGGLSCMPGDIAGHQCASGSGSVVVLQQRKDDSNPADGGSGFSSLNQLYKLMLEDVHSDQLQWWGTQTILGRGVITSSVLSQEQAIACCTVEKSAVFFFFSFYHAALLHAFMNVAQQYCLALKYSQSPVKRGPRKIRYKCCKRSLHTSFLQKKVVFRRKGRIRTLFKVLFLSSCLHIAGFPYQHLHFIEHTVWKKVKGLSYNWSYMKFLPMRDRAFAHFSILQNNTHSFCQCHKQPQDITFSTQCFRAHVGRLRSCGWQSWRHIFSRHANSP